MENYSILNRLSKILRKSGKRTVSDKIILETANILKLNGFAKPFDSIVKAIETIKPNVELRSQKKSGQSVQIPCARTTYRQEGTAIRRLTEAATTRKENKKGKSTTKTSNLKRDSKAITINSFSYHRAQEIRSILNGEGSLSLSKRDTLHRRAIAQRSARRG